ncbi:hypothetical protein WJX72_005150 [[Myrmecia] bisecta]|uniref:Delta(14)-sterol reductase ERG24 n=1 Tax=[Myrmecia] bisecta TaxID=41462 RepID=A0AAW1PGP3_9CHLO
MSEAHPYEFCGPHLGPLAIVFGLPLVCYALVFACNAQGCLKLSDLQLPELPAKWQLFSSEALLAYLGWFALVAALHLILPGKRQEGVVLPTGARLTYKLNGFYCCVVTISAALYFGFYTNQLYLGWIYDNYTALLAAAILFSFGLATLLYLGSFTGNKLLAAGGNTRYGFYNFFIGRELNPRLGSFDLKEFCELYPGMIGWLLIDLGMAHKQFTQLGHVTVPMGLVCAFHAIYVLDSAWNEPAILTTMDITSDGFGFMLVFGDLAWVPFTYTLQARYLVDHPQALSWYFIAFIIMLKALGYLMFRGANSQKDQFRRDPEHPSVRKLQTLQTSAGRKLIISGWWGISRHINYFGDWLMGWAWCLPCGFHHIIPFFYVIYFGVLLVHRERRDEHACRLKYGKDWGKYCSIVKYRIIPMLY